MSKLGVVPVRLSGVAPKMRVGDVVLRGLEPPRTFTVEEIHRDDTIACAGNTLHRVVLREVATGNVATMFATDEMV